MTDEIKIEEKHTCLCQSKGFRKFLTIAGGSFVGVFCALSLFAALHKPPMMMPAPCPCNCPCHMHHMMMKPDFRPHHFNAERKEHFNHKIMHDKFDKKAPAQNQDNAPFQREY